MNNPEMVSRTVYYQLADLFEISAVYYHEGRLILRARPHGSAAEAVEAMHRRLRAAGFEASVKEDAHGLLIGVREVTRFKWPVVNIILFLATVVTVFFAWPGPPARRIEYAVALMTILLFHEFGHYLAGRRRGVLMSLPYFLPAPGFINIIGTFGAVIKSRSFFTNRRDLIEVGAAGPIAGFVISVIALSIGLHYSQIVATGMSGGLQLGDSLLMRLLTRVIIGPIPEGYDFVLSPAAFAGWVGLLVTMLNLLPLGQLDGGHILYGLVGHYQHLVGKIFLAIIFVLGFWWPGWWLFAALAFLFRLNHPPTYNDAMPLPLSARLLGLAAILIFVIGFIPVPITLN